MTEDAFLHSVNQAYEARIKPDGRFQSHLKYEPFVEKTWVFSQSLDFPSFKRILSDIIQHHYAILPHYRKEETLNLETISWFSHSMAALFADMEYLLKAYVGQGFPPFMDSKIPHTNSSKNILCAIKKYAEFKTKASAPSSQVNLEPTNKEQAEEKYSLFPLLGEVEKVLDS